MYMYIYIYEVQVSGCIWVYTNEIQSSGVNILNKRNIGQHSEVSRAVPYPSTDVFDTREEMQAQSRSGRSNHIRKNIVI